VYSYICETICIDDTIIVQHKKKVKETRASHAGDGNCQSIKKKKKSKKEREAQ